MTTEQPQSREWSAPLDFLLLTEFAVCPPNLSAQNNTHLPLPQLFPGQLYGTDTLQKALHQMVRRKRGKQNTSSDLGLNL